MAWAWTGLDLPWAWTGLQSAWSAAWLGLHTAAPDWPGLTWPGLARLAWLEPELAGLQPSLDGLQPGLAFLQPGLRS